MIESALQLANLGALLTIGSILWKISRHLVRLELRVNLMWGVFARDHGLDRLDDNGR